MINEATILSDYQCLGMQANRDPPCQNQQNDTRTKQKTFILTRVFAVGSVDEQTRKVSFCGQQRL